MNLRSEGGLVREGLNMNVVNSGDTTKFTYCDSKKDIHYVLRIPNKELKKLNLYDPFVEAGVADKVLNEGMIINRKGKILRQGK